MGVIDLIKKFAVSLPLTDYDKREALKKKTGFDVDKAIANDKADKEIEKKPEDQELPKQPTTTTGRRTTTNYKVVSK
jgi:hypothetical protein